MTAVGKRTLLAKTCLICGELKDASQFAILQKYYRDSYCKCCHNLKARPGMYNHQQEALKVAVKHRQLWTKEEIQRLEQMASEGFSGPQMALALNRSVYAVYTMKNKLNKGS